MISDTLGHVIQLQNFRRIISLVPSWTEFICDIGSENSLVGRTSYCVEPSTISHLPSVGGTKNPDINLIDELEPDLIIGNKEENKVIDINNIRVMNIPVFMTSAINVADALDEMGKIEFLLIKSRKLTRKIEDDMSSIEPFLFSFLYLVWYDPIMVAGHNTYISKLLEFHGGKNVIDPKQDRYPKIKLADLANIEPDILILPDEPYEFTAKEITELENYMEGTRIMQIDGKTTSWYGTRMTGLKNVIEENIMKPTQSME